MLTRICTKSFSPTRANPRFSTQSVDFEELKKFAAIGKKWWDPNSKTGVGPLHQMNPTRVNFIRNELVIKSSTSHKPAVRHLEDMKILDVGCGGGLLSESLARLGANVTGIDPSFENIGVAKEHAMHDPSTAQNIYIQTTIGEHSKIHREYYDAVCSLEVVEHVPDVKQFLSECSQSLKVGGSLFLSTMNKTKKSYAIAIVAAEYITQAVPIGTHDWEKFISPQQLTTILDDLNMQVITVKGIVPDISPSKVTLSPNKLLWKLCDKDLDVNYILHAVKK